MSSNAYPLQGLSIALTRPEEQAGTSCSTLQALGAQVYSLPTIRIRYLSTQSVEDMDWLEASHTSLSLALVSSSSARALHHHLSTSYTNTQIPAWNHIYILGNKTLKSLESLNFESKSRFIATPQNDDGLAELIRTHHKKSELLVAPRGTLARLEWSTALQADGFRIKRPLIYETIDAPPSKQCPPRLDWAIFFSPSAIKAWKRLYPTIELGGCAAIGETTAKACVEEGLPLRVTAPEPNEAALHAALIRYVSDGRR